MRRRTADRLVIAPALRRRAILTAIRGARSDLRLSIFRCDDARVTGALVAASRRGVQVRVLMTPRARSAARDLIALEQWLRAHGVDVRRFSGGAKYHAKYLVADDRLAVVTTMNFTARCFERTCDFTLLTCDCDVVTGLGELFDADSENRAPCLSAAQRERLIVGPDERPRERFAALVLEARHSIRILDAKLADPPLLDLLAARARRGVVVERARRRDVRPLRRHGKLLILDGHTAVIGSLALTPRALDTRRELCVVIRDRRLVARLEAFWRAHVPSGGGLADGTPGVGLEMPQ